MVSLLSLKRPPLSFSLIILINFILQLSIDFSKCFNLCSQLTHVNSTLLSALRHLSPFPLVGVFHAIDYGTSFSNVTLHGIEWDLLVFYCLLFNVVSIVTVSSALGVGAVYAAEVLIRVLRHHFGKLNIAKKTALDDKFLVCLCMIGGLRL